MKPNVELIMFAYIRNIIICSEKAGTKYNRKLQKSGSILIKFYHKTLYFPMYISPTNLAYDKKLHSQFYMCGYSAWYGNQKTSKGLSRIRALGISECDT